MSNTISTAVQFSPPLAIQGARSSPNQRDVHATTDNQRKQATGQVGVNEQDSTQNQTTRSSSEDNQEQIERLKARDREVRAHEAAHKAVGGSLAGIEPEKQAPQQPETSSNESAISTQASTNQNQHTGINQYHQTAAGSENIQSIHLIA